jgi:hypothetical protein
LDLGTTRGKFGTLIILIIEISIFDYTAPSGPRLSMNPDSMDFGVLTINSTDMNTFEIWNSGTDILTYTISESCSWVNVTPIQGTSAGERDTVTITVNTTGLSPGSYQCNLQIQSNGGNNQFHISLYVASGNEISMNLSNGWNLLTIPREKNWNASDLADNISGCQSVSKWDQFTQSYWAYLVGGPSSFDFALEPGYGYFVETNQNDTILVNGSMIDTINISLGVSWNLIGWYHEENTTASSLADNITGCLSISKWDPDSQSYWAYLVGGPSSFDFTITRGMGVFVEIDTAGHWNG